MKSTSIWLAPVSATSRLIVIGERENISNNEGGK